MESMPRYRTTNHCVKCECFDIKDRWCNAENHYGYGRTGGEHIHRICQNCGYVWFERPLDFIYEY